MQGQKVMELIATNDARACVLFGKEEMLPYFLEREISWDLDRRSELYKSLEIYEVWSEGMIGYLAFREAETKFYLADIQLVHRHRNMGLGKALLKRTAEVAKSRGYEEVYLRVFKTSPALHLYKRFGYCIVTEEEHVYLMRAVVVKNDDFSVFKSTENPQ